MEVGVYFEKTMAKPIEKCSTYSPESTVSSLLTSCSSKSKNSSNSSGPIKYKNKLYSSASQALQAYIDDFELNSMYRDKSIRKFNLVQNSKFSKPLSKPPKGVEDFDYKRSKSLSFRNPMINDIDSISLTTDDLVRFPPDGSLSTNTYLGSVHQNTKQDRKFLKKASYYERNPRFLDHCNPVGNEDLFTPVLFSDTNEKHYGVIKKTPNKHCKYISASSTYSSEMSSPKENSKHHHTRKNYPRWLTSQKSDLNVSGISSVPDYNYPLWLHDQDLLPDSYSESSAEMQKSEHTYMEKRKTQFAHKLDCYEHSLRHCSISDSRSDKVLVNCKRSCELGQFQYETRPFSGQSKKPFSDDKIELLILKAKRTLEHSSGESSSYMKNDVNPCSLDKLEAERSWENIPVTFKSPVPVDCGEKPQQIIKVTRVHGFLEDCLNEDNSVKTSTLSGGKHHGPVEALKQMLFNLQAVQESFNRYKYDEPHEEIKQRPQDEHSMNDDVMPIARSLQKALHHLSHLRDLVEDTRAKGNLIKPTKNEEIKNCLTNKN
ncbi:lung adenoma susceptibility protein 2 isoform X3 [Monodelphis domestica]|uniref:lung adenoma susceptibility protein 2 isoform X3 n=1 Tax=Monodelphis domestica TaxID=13616 RepID=UPI000443634B|nr:lung adenoma susceptibility protein 2 isoform X3 [Monodelphis domestica]